MALNAGTLQTAIYNAVKAEIDSRWPPVNSAAEAGHADLAHVIAAIATPIVDHIVANATVTVDPVTHNGAKPAGGIT